MENSLECLICCKPGADVNVTPKGIESILAASQKRGDEKFNTFSVSQAQIYRVHEGCRKAYTSSKNITTSCRKSTNGPEQSYRILRKPDDSFSYKTNCLICGGHIDLDNIKKHPDRQGVSSVEIVDNSEKSSKLQSTLLEVCSKRTDAQASRVHSRIVCAGDIRAVEAVYHRPCMQLFLLWDEKTHKDNSRNLNTSNSEAFLKLCQLINSQTGTQYTITDLSRILASFLPEDTDPYSDKHLKRKLQDYFGANLTITEIEGKKNVYTFSRTAASILNENYSIGDAADEEELYKEARHVGKSLRNTFMELRQNGDCYPSPEDVNIEQLESQIPKLLLTLMQSLFGKSNSSEINRRVKLQVVSLCHMIMHACAQNSYQSPLLLSSGLFIHQTTRSKVLLNTLSALGMTITYDQVLDFERSAVTSESVLDIHPGIDTSDQRGYCQWVADNFDYNEDTTSGHDSTHVMGIITCQTPPSQTKTAVKKKKLLASDIVQAGDFDNIQPYLTPQTNHMSKHKFCAISAIEVPKLHDFKLQDTLWMLSNFRSQITPGWQGFMADIVTGTFNQSQILYHPMIPLNPQTSEAVYSTMAFVNNQRQKVGQCCALLTFDQPLYAKAFKIKTDHPSEFSHVKLRLGGFHQLMSFLGAGCKSMQFSGMEELWSTVYATNSIPKMFEGKSYSKTVRACLLTSAALHILLFDNQSNLDSDIPEHSNSTIKSDNDALLQVEKMVKDLSDHTVNVDEISSTALSCILETVEKKKMALQESRTARLWFQFMDFVSIICTFIRAERTGNWLLHLKSCQDMLPWFSAMGHNNYAKYCRLYIQDFINPCPCLMKPLSDGLFTVHRNKQLFWSGTWSDMTIEQSLMRSGKTQGGLINITHKDSARTRWLLSAHVVAQYTEELRQLSNLSNYWADHHREINPGRVRQDYKDMMKFHDYLKMHNPFRLDICDLRNISTGVIADARVNVDSLIEVGSRIQDGLTNCTFGEVSFKKNSQVVTLEVMKKALTLINGEKVLISSTELYQRLLSIAYSSGPPPPSIFSYELASVSPSLFHDDGTMRKSTKSQLVNFITDLYPEIVEEDRYQPQCVIIDGCALLQQLKWPKVGTMADVCTSYVSAVSNRCNHECKVTVVFDSYAVQTTKDQEQMRRKQFRSAMPDVAVSTTTPVPGDSASFLSNKKNKQQIINLISSQLQDSGIDVHHAGIEGDADILIVRKVVELAQEHDTIHVFSDDTDVFVVLLYHVDLDSTVYMKTRSRMLSIHTAKQRLGTQMCQLLPFVHAMSGCDTTSAIFGFGKTKHFKHVIANMTHGFHDRYIMFGEAAVPKEVIGEIGELYIAGLYSSRNDLKLDELRFMNIKSSRYVSIERMPPTSRAAFFHSQRVHLQVSTWKNLATVLDKSKFGFKCENGHVIPVITDRAPAPADLLKEVRCCCRSINKPCRSCSCVKRGLRCSIHCKCRGTCENGSVGDDDDTD